MRVLPFPFFLSPSFWIFHEFASHVFGDLGCFSGVVMGLVFGYPLDW